jgi:hypothetical protein
MAPFQAVPSPGPTEHPSAPLPDVSAPTWDRTWLEQSPTPDAPATVVPVAGQRPAEAFRAPVAPSPAVPKGNPAYRDWTRPSGSGAAPATTAIPDREIVRDRAGADETVVPATEVPATVIPDAGDHDERFPDDTPSPDEDRFSGGRGSGLPDLGAGERPAATGPTSGSQTGVVGGRAALRAERQAAEEGRRREAKRTGVKHVRTPVPGTEDDEPRPTRRRGVAALVAVVVVALLVLGVYSFASPEPQEASDPQDATPTTSAPVQTSGALPPLNVDPLPPVDEAPATPVRVPVTVLNATDVTGLASTIAGLLDEGGWPTLETGAYEGTDVPVTTVYFTEGDEAQRQSALQLVEAHPEVTGPAVRFFEVSEAAAGGLVVVAAGDWKP